MAAAVSAMRGAYHNRLAQLARHVVAGEEVETDVDTGSENLSARAIAAKARDPESAMRSALESGKIPDLSVGADGSRLSEKLPGPLQDRDKTEVLLEVGRAEAAGTNHSQWMEWQEQYGDAGLESNIVIPHIVRERVGTEFKTWYTEKVMLSDPDDCIRIARAHTQKQPNFQIFMGDSVRPPLFSSPSSPSRRSPRRSLTVLSDLARGPLWAGDQRHGQQGVERPAKPPHRSLFANVFAGQDLPGERRTRSGLRRDPQEAIARWHPEGQHGESMRVAALRNSCGQYTVGCTGGRQRSPPERSSPATFRCVFADRVLP